MTNIEKLKLLVDQLTKLLKDPEPGLFTWRCALGSCLDEIAVFAPSMVEIGESARDRATLLKLIETVAERDPELAAWLRQGLEPR